MKQYALVKDTITGDTYGVVIRENGSETCLAVKTDAEAWADGFNDMHTKSLDDDLPYGVRIGDFRGMTEAEEVIVNEMALTKQDLRLPNRDVLTLIDSQRTDIATDPISVKDAPIAFFGESAEKAVDYKVRAFISDMARGSVLAKARNSKLGIERKGLVFKSRNNDQYLREDLANMAMGYGPLRRAAKDVFHAKQDILDDHDGYRLDDQFDLHVKALGPKLGGGLRAAPRGMAFVDITGRVDGDRDGIVFEGVTGMERPIIPRFIVPQGMARRVSRALEGDSMEIEKRRRAGERDLGIDQATLNDRLGNDARFLQAAPGTQGQQSRRATRRTGRIGGGAELLGPKRNRPGNEDYPRMDPERVARLRLERFVQETSPSGRARQNRIINTPGADGGPSRRAVRERSGRVIPEPPARDRGGMRSQRQSQRTDWTGDGKPFYLRNDPQSELVAKRRDEFGRLEEIYRNTETGKFFGRQTGFSDYDTEGISIRDGDKRQFDTAEEVQRVAEADSLSQFNGSNGLRSQRATGDDIRATLSRIDKAEGGYASLGDDLFDNIRFAADYLDGNTDANSDDAFDFLLAALTGVRDNKDIKPKDRRELEKQINDALRRHSMLQPKMGGMRSRRSENEDGSVPEGDFVDIDLTMEEVGYLSDIVDSIRDDIAAANDSEADELWQEFSDAIEDAAAGVDVVRLDRADAERLREMLEDLYTAEVEQGNPSPEEGDVLDLLGRAIDSPDGVWVSPSIEDNGGTRLSTGGMGSRRRVRAGESFGPEARYNVEEIDGDRALVYDNMNRTSEWRDLDTISPDDTPSRFEGGGGLASRRMTPEQMAEKRNEMERDLRSRAARELGVSDEEYAEMEKYIDDLPFDDDSAEWPGEIEDAGESRGGPTGQRTSWGARVSESDEVREGIFPDGPMEGSRWTFNRNEFYSEDTFDDPGESLEGTQTLTVDTPNGTRITYSSGLEDAPSIERVQKISGNGGLRASRGGGDTANSLAPSQPSSNPKTYGTYIPKSMKDVRKDLQMLAANGWVWQGPVNGNIRFAPPDRFYEWAKRQPDSWKQQFGERLMRGGIVPREFGLHPKQGNNQSVIRELKKRVEKVYGEGAWADMQKNAKNDGIGKVGNVPSVVSSGGGMQSARGGRSRIRGAQDEITGASGLGGGMRAGRRRFGSGRNGIKKVDDRDGKIMEQLTPEQREKMIEAIKEREGQLAWAMTQNGLFRPIRNTMEDDGRYEGMSLDERKRVPIDTDLIPRMQQRLDDALRDGDITEEAHAAFQKQLNDIKTLNNMRESNKFDFIEHLHEPSRKEIVKRARSKDKSIPTLAALDGAGESTFFNEEAFGSAQGAAETVSERAARRRGKRRRPLFDRLLDPDPSRAQRRANRRARRQGRGGRRATDVDLAETIRLRRRLARQMRRLRRRLRGERNEKSIREALEAKRSAHPLKRDKLGRPVVDAEFLKHMSSLKRLKDERDRGERNSETKDDFLRDLWENGNMNALPEILSEDEVQALLDAGWKPLHRGVGPDGTANQYSDAYREDRDSRFISDPHRRAYGTGEYWAPEGSGHWGGYGKGMVGFVDPNGRKISGRDIESIKDKHNTLRKELSALMAELGDGALKGEDPANAVTQIRTRIKEAEERLGVAGLLESEMGQIYSQWLDMYAGMKPDDAGRSDAWDSFEYLQDLTRLDSGYYAAFLGYDYVEHNGVTLVHNRGTVAVADTASAISGGEASQMLSKAKEGDGVKFP